MDVMKYINPAAQAALMSSLLPITLYRLSSDLPEAKAHKTSKNKHKAFTLTMSHSLYSTLSLLLLPLLLPTLSSAACTSFTPLNSTTFTTFYGSQNVTVSALASCPANSTLNCYVGDRGIYYPSHGNYTWIDTLIGGIVTNNATLRLPGNSQATLDKGPWLVINGGDAPTAASTSLFQLVTSASGLKFTNSITQNLTAAGAFELVRGMQGYAVWMPDMQCVRGVLNGCSGGEYPANGTEVEACSPVPASGKTAGGFADGAGSLTWMDVPANVTSANVSCWPCEVERKLTGAAAGGIGMGMGVRAVAVVGVVVVGMSLLM